MRRLLQFLRSSWRVSARPSGPFDFELRAKRLAPFISGGLLVGSLSLYHNGLWSSLKLRLSHSSFSGVAAAEKPRTPSNVNFIADVVEKVLPAVVCIETGHRLSFRASSGSGFIFREDGYILTNFHVVGSNSQVKIRLSDNREMTGRVVAANPNLDLALVKVSANGLPFIELGRSSALRTGEWVVALGAPRFLTNSVTVGVVSATNRDLGIQRGQRYIQTDAAITHGNSGGPLVNVEGQVVGINSMKLEAGIGFAIPSDDIKKFVTSSLDLGQSGQSLTERFGFSSRSKDSHSNGGKKQAYIGVNMMSLENHVLYDLRRMMPGYFDGVTHGVMVHSVYPGSPASQAGLRQFDVIVRMNGVDINSAKEVYAVVENLPFNGNVVSIEMEVMRQGSPIKVVVKPEIMDVDR